MGLVCGTPTRFMLVAADADTQTAQATITPALEAGVKKWRSMSWETYTLSKNSFGHTSQNIEAPYFRRNTSFWPGPNTIMIFSGIPMFKHPKHPKTNLTMEVGVSSIHALFVHFAPLASSFLIASYFVRLAFLKIKKVVSMRLNYTWWVFSVKSVFYFMLMDTCGNPLVMTLFGKPF